MITEADVIGKICIVIEELKHWRSLEILLPKGHKGEIQDVSITYNCTSNGECEDECNCEEEINEMSYLLMIPGKGFGTWIDSNKVQIINNKPLPVNFKGENCVFSNIKRMR